MSERKKIKLIAPQLIKNNVHLIITIMKTFVKYLFIAFFLLFSSNGFAQKSLTDFIDEPTLKRSIF